MLYKNWFQVVQFLGIVCLFAYRSCLSVPFALQSADFSLYVGGGNIMSFLIRIGSFVGNGNYETVDFRSFHRQMLKLCNE